MGRYCITLELTKRISKWFEAECEDQAWELAEKINNETEDSEYEPGDSERDYSLCDAKGRTIISWR